MIVIGKNEKENNKISIRKRTGEKVDNIALETLENELKVEIEKIFN